MRHESAVARNAFTSAAQSSRPPGFAPTSLDYKTTKYDGTNLGEKETLLNPRPAKRKNQQQQPQELQQQRGNQHQKPLHPTRAKGNFGPPPHRITTLKDLEHMTDEQLYNMFMKDPELYRSLMKSAEESRSSSSPPSGARKSHSKTSRRDPIDRLGENKEIPYFQWSVILFLLAVGLYQLYKSFASTSRNNKMRAAVLVGPKAKGSKQKKQKNKKTENGVLSKDIFGLVETEVTATTKTKPTGTTSTTKVPKRPSVQKKKKNTKSVMEGKPDNHQGQAKKEEKQEPNPAEDSAASVAAVPTGPSSIVPMNHGSNIEGDNDGGDDEAWQTVAKPKGNKVEPNKKKNSSSSSEKNVSSSIEEVVNVPVASIKPLNKNGAEPASQNESVATAPSLEATVAAESNAKSNGKREETTAATPQSDDKDSSTSNNGQNVIPGKNNASADGGSSKKKKKQAGKKLTNSTSNKSIAKSSDEDISSVNDDEALALQLQKEEEDRLARADTSETNHVQEDAWEEVTTKKKKGVKASVLDAC
jgi:hypothetical protein